MGTLPSPNPSPITFQNCGPVPNPAPTQAPAPGPKSPPYEEVSKLFSLPLSDAANSLGVCPSVLKKVCYDNGLVRWPYRNFLAGKSIEEIKKEAAIEKEKKLAGLKVTREGSIASASPAVSTPLCGNSSHQRQSINPYTQQQTNMAATSVISSAGTAVSGALLCRGQLTAKPQSLNLCFRSGRLLAQKRRLFTCNAIHNPQFQTKEEGQPETRDHRVFFVDKSGKKISPWHDIPLHLGDGVFNFIVEIPKESSAKMEVATDELYTPIKQDTKKGKLRYYPYNINWNYGLLPQTWEDPLFSNAEVDGAFGDNDPVDVVEIGESQGKIGQVLKVKPLAALAMIDEGELDWKIVAISLDDPRASLVNDIDDVEKHFPGILTAIRDWFRDYKIPDGKPANKFGLGNKPANKDYALKIINETNESWAKLVKRSISAGELSLV